MRPEPVTVDLPHTAGPTHVLLHPERPRARGGQATVLVLHGFGGEAGAWALCLGALARRATVIAPDLPGHGRSAALADTGDPLDALTGWAVAAALRLGRGEVHLAGHSLGGLVALRAAGVLGDRVASVTVLAPAGLGQPVDTGLLRRAITADGAEAARAAAAELTGPGTDPGLLVLVAKGLAKAAADAPRRRARLALLEAMADAGLRTDANAVTGLRRPVWPTGLVWGAADRVIAPPPPWPGLARDRRLAGIGHLLPLEAPSAVIAAITAPLQDRDVAAGR